MQNGNTQGSEKRELKIERLNIFCLIIFLDFYPSLATVSCYWLMYLSRGDPKTDQWQDQPYSMFILLFTPLHTSEESFWQKFHNASKPKKSFTSRNTTAQVLCFSSWCQGPALLSFRRHLSSRKQQHSFRFQHSLASLQTMTETSFSSPNVNNGERLDCREAIGDFWYCREGC